MLINTHNMVFYGPYGILSLNYHQIPILSVSGSQLILWINAYLRPCTGTDHSRSLACCNSFSAEKEHVPGHSGALYTQINHTGGCKRLDNWRSLLTNHLTERGCKRWTTGAPILTNHLTVRGCTRLDFGVPILTNHSYRQRLQMTGLLVFLYWLIIWRERLYWLDYWGSCTD